MQDSTIQHGPVAASAEKPGAAAAKQAELVAQLCGLGATMSNAMQAVPGFVPCGHAFGVVIEGLFAATACADATQLDAYIEAVAARSEHVSAHRGVPQGAAAAPVLDTPEAALLFSAIRGIAADAYAAMELGRMDDDVDVLLANALAALGAGTVDHDLLTRAASASLKVQRLLA